MNRVWIATVSILTIGYLVLSRTFSYIGIPSMKIFIGEIVLVAFVLLRPQDIIGRSVTFIVESSAFTGFIWAYIIFFSYGLFELARGIANEYSPLTAAQNLVFNYYPLYIFLGLYAGTLRPDLLSKIVNGLAWVNGVYGLAYLMFFSKSYVGFADDVGLFGQPAGTVICIVGMFCFWRGWGRSIVPLALNALVLVGVQVRSDWLSAGIAIVLLGVVTKRFERLVAGGVVCILLLGIGFVTDVKLPGEAQRGGDVSVRDMVGRVLAPIDLDLAKEYNSSAKGYEATVIWRRVWWRGIWSRVHEDPTSRLFGLSYGFPLGDLSPLLQHQAIRTPHNVFYYALGYGGWFGVGIFFLFQSQLGWLTWRSFQMTGQPFALVMWVQVLINAFFGNVLETPAGAIPLYLLLGVSYAPILQRSSRTIATSPGWSAQFAPAGMSGYDGFATNRVLLSPQKLRRVPE